MFAKKSLGQNFLMHKQTAERIAEAAGVSARNTVLEIGPGTGMLTKVLLSRAAHVIAIEKDDTLYIQLYDTFTKEIAEGRLTLLHADARTFDASTIASSYLLVANIPYNITGELVRKFLTAAHKPTSLTFLVQKEVAERIARSRKESILSLSVKAFGTPTYRFTVPRGAFKPAPNVDSAVLSITDIHEGFASLAEEERFFAALHAGFAHKRKLLARNLEAIATGEVIRKAFSAAGVPEKARAEDLPLGSWKKIASALSS